MDLRNAIGSNTPLAQTYSFSVTNALLVYRQNTSVVFWKGEFDSHTKLGIDAKTGDTSSRNVNLEVRVLHSRLQRELAKLVKAAYKSTSVDFFSILTGPLAQMGERLVEAKKAAGSKPAGTTIVKDNIVGYGVSDAQKALTF